MRPSFAMLTALVALLEGCTVGPNFLRPTPPTATAYLPESAAPNLERPGGEPSQPIVNEKSLNVRARRPAVS
jgi:hypothetical protein